MKALTVVQPRAYFISHRRQGIIVCADDALASRIRQKERIAIYAPARFDAAELEKASHFILGEMDRKRFAALRPGNFAREVVLCTVKVWRLGWIHDPMMCGGALEECVGKFGITVIDPVLLRPPFLVERESDNGDLWEWNVAGQDANGQVSFL